MSIIDKKVVIFMSFGHCGIDWLHSLLDSHPEILILPQVSFYRVWKIINGDSIRNPDDLFLALHDHLENHPYRKHHELLDNDKNNKLFYEKLESNLNQFGCNRKSVFFSIHEAYAHANSINLENIKVIVEQEHVCFPSKAVIDDFGSSNLLFILRDPRAAIAGFYRGVQRKCGSDLRCYRYRSAEHLSGWRYAVRLWKENNVKIVKNELLVQDLKREMTDISDWMGLKYNSILTVSTSSNGTAWKTDSCYISRDDPEVEKNIFFSPENVKKRWMGVLSKKEITIIESIFSDVFSEFDYDRIVEKKILNSISGYLYFIFPNKIWRNYFRNNSFLKALHLYFSDVYTHIFVLYGDGSKKYD